MVLSTRVNIQWLPNEPTETSHTLVFTTSQDHFVDVRIKKDMYPFKQDGAQPVDFNEVFEWVIVGEEEPIANTNKIQFNHKVNLQEIMKSLTTGKPLLECKSAPDIGSFSAIEGSKDRKEMGRMVNPETGKSTEYVEIWRSLNPEETTFETEVRENENKDGHEISGPVDVYNATYDLEEGSVYGRVIVLGRWIQGVIYDSSDKSHPLSVLRAYREDSGAWRTLIRYGRRDFGLVDGGDVRKEAGWNQIE